MLREPLHRLPVRAAETDARVELVRSGRVQDPPRLAAGPVLDQLADELDPEAAAAVLGEDVEVGEVDVGDAVGEAGRPLRA